MPEIRVSPFSRFQTREYLRPLWTELARDAIGLVRRVGTKPGAGAPGGGRKATHCPYIARGIKDDTIYFGALEAIDLDQAYSDMVDFLPQYLALCEGVDDPLYHSAVIMLPNFRDLPEDAGDILRIHLSVEHYLPRAGLMLGFLGKTFQDPTSGMILLNQLLIVRQMTPEDWRFFPRFPDRTEQGLQRAKYREKYGEPDSRFDVSDGLEPPPKTRD